VSADRVALVTGCGKPDGAGQAIARALAADGVTVVAADRQPRGVLNRRQEMVGSEQPDSWSGLETLVAEIEVAGGRASFVLGDLASADDCETMVATAAERHGSLDILVNNAAAPQGADRQLLHEVPVEVIDLVLSINLRGTFLMCRAAIPHMRERRWGRIINVASQAGAIGVARHSPYSASKAGVMGLTRALSMELAGFGVTVNAISPGALGTSRSVLSLDPDYSREHHLEMLGSRIPVGRVGTPDDMAAAVRYLVGDGASYMTGQILVLDGGGPAPFGVPRPEGDA
jgi:3-oxoacyl-[acyl-carrier protein] reductase